MKIDSHTMSLALQPESVEQAAMVLEQQLAAEQRKSARARRSAAQQEAIDAQHEVAAKLRSMANNALASGLWQAGLGMAGALCTAAATGIQAERAGRLSAVEGRVADGSLADRGATYERLRQACSRYGKVAEGALGATQQLLGAAGKIDPFQIRSANLAAEKESVQLRAQKAQQVAGDTDERVRDAKDYEGKALQRYEDMARIRHEIEMTPLRKI